MDGVTLATKFVTNRTDTVTPKQGDLPQPLPLFYAQALEHRCEMMRDIASFMYRTLSGKRINNTV